MLTEEELEAKLGKWAGFEEQGSGFWFPVTREFNKLPHFTKSVDACFNYLVPKTVMHLCASLHIGEAQAYRSLYESWVENLIGWSERPNSLIFVVRPAYTFCLTIEKLINDAQV
jgi:hypothetical protein